MKKQNHAASILLALMLVLAPAPHTAAAGAPVFDVTAAWKAIQNFRNTMRGVLDAILQTDKPGNADEKAKEEAQKAGIVLTSSQIEKVLNRKAARCNRILNPESQSLCREMVVLEKAKISIFTKEDRRIADLWKRYTEKVNKYNDIQSRGLRSVQNIGGPLINAETHTGELESLADEIQDLLQKISQAINNAQMQATVLDNRIEILRKARVQIVRDQMQGDNLINAGIKTGIMGVVIPETRKYREKILNKRSDNRNASNSAFFGNAATGN